MMRKSKYSVPASCLDALVREKCQSKTQSIEFYPYRSLPLAGLGDPMKFAKGVLYIPIIFPFTPLSPQSTSPSRNSFRNENNFLDGFV